MQWCRECGSVQVNGEWIPPDCATVIGEDEASPDFEKIVSAIEEAFNDTTEEYLNKHPDDAYIQFATRLALRLAERSMAIKRTS